LGERKTPAIIHAGAAKVKGRCGAAAVPAAYDSTARAVAHLPEHRDATGAPELKIDHIDLSFY